MLDATIKKRVLKALISKEGLNSFKNLTDLSQNPQQATCYTAFPFSFHLYCHLYLPVILSILLSPLLLHQFVSIFYLYLHQDSDPLPAPSHCHSDEADSKVSFMRMNPLSCNSRTIKSRKSTTNLTDRTAEVLLHVGVIFLSAFVCAQWKLESIMCSRACHMFAWLDVGSCLCKVSSVLRK